MDCYNPFSTEKPKTFDEVMKEGQSRDDGLAGSMKIREAYEKPWHVKQHKPTRCDK